MTFRESLSSERGSLAPLWAIGGLLLVISIFWVENFTWVMLYKYRDFQLTNTLARASLLENAGSSSNLQKIASAAGAEPGKQVFSQGAMPTSLEDLDKLIEDERLEELLTLNFNFTENLEVPFTSLNHDVGIPETSSLSTEDQTVKVFRPIHVILAVEASTNNKSTMSQVVTPLTNALQRLVKAAKDSRFSIVPYSYRINYSGKCYTGIERGDDFDFSWWERFFGEEERLSSLKNSLSSAKNRLNNTYNTISSKRSQINALKKQQQELEAGTAEYNDIQEQINQLEDDISDLQDNIPDLQYAIEQAQEKVDQQQDVVDELKESEQYVDYLELAKHYAKRYRNYKYFEDYNDTIANSGLYSITKDNYLAAAGNITSSPEWLSKLAVTRNKYFGDTTTCPSTSVSYNLDSASNVRNAINSIDYSGPNLLSLEGLLWAGRTIYGKPSSLMRNVVLLFISDKEEQNDPEELPGVSEACSTLKNTYRDNKASKLVIVGASQDAIDKFSRFSCATSWYSDAGTIALDEIEGDFNDELEERFTFYLSQESTTKNVNKK
ncbi:hypothetical protein LXD80_12460 [Enterobacter sp. ASE]|uniref:coiled-coil domain-containing protein n=1 Tax=Enterobacter sp. ASE TaxID=2905968 RepID=UPI001E4A2E95|nr:hypothetical protein [Enterobacter sp. ASE]MCE3116606.1 hypothetical protein [Enterobacter sp. ASE]